MKLNTKMLLKDKNVLRVVVFVALVNLLGYVMVKDFNAVMFFIIVGFLSTYYSKNMIIVSLIAMVATNVMVVAKRKTREGMSSSDEIKAIAKAVVSAAKKDRDAGKPEDESTTSVRLAAAIEGATLPQSELSAKTAITSIYGGKSDAEAESEVEKALAPDVSTTVETPTKKIASETESFSGQTTPYENLGGKIDHSFLTNIDEDADTLVERQKKLLEQYEKLQPALERSYKLLNSMGGADGVQGMIEKVGGMIDKFGGMSK